MKASDALRTALASLDEAGARRAWGYALLHLAERLVLVGVALSLGRGRGIETLASAVVLSAIVVGRAAVRTALTRHIQADLHRRAVDKLLEGDLLAASASADDDPEASILEGVASGVRLLGCIVPECAADALATVVVIGVLAAVEPPRLLLVGGVALFFACGGLLVANRIGGREEARAWGAYQPVIDGLVATIGARLEIVSNGVSESFRAARAREVEHWEKTSHRATMLIAFAGRLPAGIAVLVVASVVLIERSLSNELSGAMWFAHAALFGACLPALVGLGRNLLEATRHSVRFASLASLLASPPLPAGKGDAGKADGRVTLPAAIVWRDVAVRYARGTESALSGIDATWTPGQVLVLRGPNGSGKSTLLRTLLAVAPLERGALSCGGVDLAEIDLDTWRTSIGYLAQRPFLPHRGAVKDAFAIVAPDASEGDIQRALERVGLLGVLTRRSPPSPLSVDAGSLSVGERQRLALARVLANGKPLVLLDEPDANLDRAGVRFLAATVRELAAEGRMVAIAAHTDEIVALGDIVVSLERGRITSPLDARASGRERLA